MLLVQGLGEGNFLKGLAVIDDVAYFGISPGAERSMRANPELDCELAALDLLQKRLLWRRKVTAPASYDLSHMPPLHCIAAEKSWYDRHLGKN